MDLEFDEEEYEYEDKGDTAMLVRKSRRRAKTPCGDFRAVLMTDANGFSVGWQVIHAPHSKF